VFRSPLALKIGLLIVVVLIVGFGVSTVLTIQREADLLIEQLTLTSDLRGLDRCVERLVEFERLGLSEIALAPHGDPVSAIKLIGTAVIPTVDRAGALRVP